MAVFRYSARFGWLSLLRASISALAAEIVVIDRQPQAAGVKLDPKTQFKKGPALLRPKSGRGTSLMNANQIAASHSSLIYQIATDGGTGGRLHDGGTGGRGSAMGWRG